MWQWKSLSTSAGIRASNSVGKSVRVELFSPQIVQFVVSYARTYRELHEYRSGNRKRPHKVSDVNASFMTALFISFLYRVTVESVKTPLAEYMHLFPCASKWKNTFPESRCNERFTRYRDTRI